MRESRGLVRLQEDGRRGGRRAVLSETHWKRSATVADFFFL